jgi:Uma2 family endonuclease
MDAEKQRITVDEFESFLAEQNGHAAYELIDGEIVEKMTTEEHGIIALNIGTLLNIYLWNHPVGRASVETRYRIETDAHNDRLPDVSVTTDLERPVTKVGAVPRVPDLAVEIKSPGDSMNRMLRKATFFLDHGAQIVWIVHPEKRSVQVYTPSDAQIFSESDTLSGDPVLPGFTLAVRDIFRGI